MAGNAERQSTPIRTTPVSDKVLEQAYKANAAFDAKRGLIKDLPKVARIAIEDPQHPIPSEPILVRGALLEAGTRVAAAEVTFQLATRELDRALSVEHAADNTPDKSKGVGRSNSRGTAVAKQIPHATCNGQGCEGCNFAKTIWTQQRSNEKRPEPKRITIDYLTDHPDDARQAFTQPGRQIFLTDEDRFKAIVVTLTDHQAAALLPVRSDTARPTETYTYEAFARFPYEIVNRLTQRETIGYLIAGDIIAKLIPYKQFTRR